MEHMFEVAAMEWDEDESSARTRERLDLPSLPDEEDPTAVIERLLDLSRHARLVDLEASALVEVAAAFAEVEAWAAAGLRSAAAHLDERRGSAGHDVSRGGGRRFEVVSPAADELAMRLGCSRRRSGRLIAEGRTFGGMLFPVGTDLARGAIDAGKSAIFAELLEDQAPAVAFAVCDEILPQAPRLTHHALRTRIQKAIIAVDPRGAAERSQSARSTRRLEHMQLLGNGMASLRLVAPVFDIAAVETMADAAARATRAGGDPRTLEQLRVDAVVAAATAALAAGHVACSHTGANPVATGTEVASGSSAAEKVAGTASAASAVGSAGTVGTALPRVALPEPRPLSPSALRPSQEELDALPLEDALTRLREAERSLLADPSPMGLISAAVHRPGKRRRRGGRGRRPERTGIAPHPESHTWEPPSSAARDALRGTSSFVPFSGPTAVITLEADPTSLDPPPERRFPAEVYDEEFAGADPTDTTAPGTASPGTVPPETLTSGASPSGTSPSGTSTSHSPPATAAPLDPVPRLLGLAPLDPATARFLAANAPPFLRVAAPTAVGAAIKTTLTPSTGAGGTTEPRSTTATEREERSRYRPSRALRRQVQRDHPTCVAPSCTVPSTSCDLDHVVPFPLGPTSRANLRPLCRRHHLLKTHAGHTLTLLPDGTALWRTPTGHTYQRAVGSDVTHLTGRPSLRSLPRSRRTSGASSPRTTSPPAASAA